MNQHDQNTVEVPLTKIADVWRRYAELDGIARMTTELVGVMAGRWHRDGYWPGFYLPATGRLVIVKGVQPYPTQTAARGFLAWMLQQLHHNGNITLYPRELDQETAPAPAQEAIA